MVQQTNPQELASGSVNTAGGWRAIFKPALAVLNKLRYAPKFVVVGLILLVPFAFTAYLQWSGSTDSADFSQLESDGVEHIDGVNALMWEVQRHRLYVAGILGGEPEYGNKTNGVRTKAQAAIGVLEELDAKYGEEFETSKGWQLAKSHWKNIVGTQFTSIAQSEAAHKTMTDELNQLINVIGDQSNLILDPDLDSYWLMDAFVVKNGVFGEAIARAATRALDTETDAKAAADRIIELSALYQTLGDTTNELVTRNMVTAYAENQKKLDNNDTNFTMTAKPRATANELQAEVAGFAQAVKLRHLSGEEENLGARGTIDPALASLARLEAFAAAVGPDLDALCIDRADGYRANRTTGLLAAVFAILLLLYLFYALYLSVKGSVSNLGLFTRRMIAGTNEKFTANTADELGDVTQDYNLINAALVESRELGAKVESKNKELQANILDLLSVVSDASDGDLTVRAQVTTGALGNVADGFNQLLESLEDVIREVLSQVSRTNVAVEGISTSATNMATGAANQAREINQVVQQVQAMSQSIGNVASTANDAAEAAKRTEESAVEGTEAVQRVIRGMDGLRSNVQAGAKKMKGLGDRSMEITGIVETIARISEQTNMLALNAAIEAARAGEHGRGFTVVAEEVRKLAERTANATQEIDKLVSAIHAETTETVHAIEQQTQVVEQESVTVSHAGDSLASIRGVSSQSANLVADISKTAQSEVEGTKRVVASMSQVSAIAQQTQQGAEATVATVDELRALSEQLTKTVRQFKVA